MEVFSESLFSILSIRALICCILMDYGQRICQPYTYFGLGIGVSVCKFQDLPRSQNALWVRPVAISKLLSKSENGFCSWVPEPRTGLLIARYSDGVSRAPFHTCPKSWKYKYTYTEYLPRESLSECIEDLQCLREVALETEFYARQKLRGFTRRSLSLFADTVRLFHCPLYS